MLDLFLKAVGAGSVVAAALVLYRVLRAIICNTDNQTASCKLRPQSFADRVVWITGASSGIGAEMARQLAAQGAKLVLSARRDNALEALKTEIQQTHGVEARVLRLDLEDLDSLADAAKTAMQQFGRVDVLVNNGGFSQRSVGRDTSFDVDLKMTKVNYLSYIALSKAVLPGMLTSGRPCQVVNVSSAAGKFGPPLRTSYAGVKHALMGFFDALRLEEHGYFGSNVHICTVCPGSITTEVARNSATADGSAFGRSDEGNDAGLEVGWSVARILAGMDSLVDEIWIAPSKQMMALYLAQYFPGILKARLLKDAKMYVGQILGDHDSTDKSKKTN